MAWVNLDDRFPWHRNNAGLTDAAFRLHVTGIAYCNRELTDGVIEADEVPVLVRRYRKAALVELLDKGHWLPLLDGHLYQIRDYLDWNDSREVVLKRRETNAKRQGRFRSKGNGGDSA